MALETPLPSSQYAKGAILSKQGLAHPVLEDARGCSPHQTRSAPPGPPPPPPPRPRSCVQPLSWLPNCYLGLNSSITWLGKCWACQKAARINWQEPWEHWVWFSRVLYQESEKQEFRLRTQHIGFRGLPKWLSGTRIRLQCRRHRRCRFNPWVGKIPWRRAQQPAPVFLPGEVHCQRSLVGYSL